MGGKDSKPLSLSYEEAVKRGECRGAEMTRGGGGGGGSIGHHEERRRVRLPFFMGDFGVVGSAWARGVVGVREGRRRLWDRDEARDEARLRLVEKCDIMVPL